MVNLDHIREFLVFSRTLNYTQAAKELFIAQPTLIQHVQKLETTLGFSLVTHDRNPRLTKAGKLFSIEGERLLDNFASLVDRCSKIEGEAGEQVRIINFPNMIDTSSVAALAAGHKLLRPAFVAFDPADRDEFAILDDNIADFSVTMAEGPSADLIRIENKEEYGFIPLPAMKCSIIARSDNPLSKKDQLPLSALNGLTTVMDSSPFYSRNGDAFRAQLRENGLNTKCIGVSNDLMDMLVKSSDEYVFVFPERAQNVRQMLNHDDDFVSIPLQEPSIRIYPFAIFRKDNPNPHVHEFAELWEASVRKESGQTA